MECRPLSPALTHRNVYGEGSQTLPLTVQNHPSSWNGKLPHLHTGEGQAQVLCDQVRSPREAWGGVSSSRGQGLCVNIWRPLLAPPAWGTPESTC